MSNLTKKSAKILIVDDSPTILITFSKILTTQGYLVRSAQTGAEAIAETASWKPNCILLDYFLPDMTGEEVLTAVREFDNFVQVVLVTAHAQEKPPLEMMDNLDIQGFHDKKDHVSRLILWVGAALKAHSRIVALQERADTMQRILVLGRRIHQPQPTHMLLQLVLDEVHSLTDSPSGAVLLGEDILDVVMSYGNPSIFDESNKLTSDVQHIINIAKKQHDEFLICHNNLFGLVLRPGTNFAGCALYTQRNLQQPLPETELKILAQHVSLAMENNRLHGMATIDPLTGLASRAYLNQRLREWLQLSVRHSTPLSLLFVDLDKLKKINDSYGHHIGDQIISLVGKRIRASIRSTDIAGRQGGDEFVIVAPNTNWRDAKVVAERICNRIASLRCTVSGITIPLSASVGFGGFDALNFSEFFQQYGSSPIWNELCIALLHWVDQATYQAKQKGGGCVVAAGNEGQLTAQTTEKINEIHANILSQQKRYQP